VAVGEPIRFVVTLTADESVTVLKPPARPELEKLAEFRDRFDLEAPDPPQRHEGNKWEFYYLLRPRSEAVKEIPEVAFCYFNPDFGQNPQGYQVAYPDDVISITVTPKAAEPPKVSKSLDLDVYPLSVRQLPATEDLLKQDRPWTPPSAGWLVVLLIGPPVVALGWLLVWRRLYPDVATRARLRRSRAARTALAGLARLRTAEPDRMAEQLSGIVTGYLRERLDLNSAVPTPAEVETFLRGLGVPDPLREKASALLQSCDALRFAPVPPAVSGSLTDEAEQIILELEALTWSSPRS
jgi:hypothetical protein